jgi:hypothetical protein
MGRPHGRRFQHPDLRRLPYARILGYRRLMMTLREQVEQLLPDWENWYPSLFDAARDLGVIRARVCDPGSLLLSNRHAGIQSEAARAHRERWSIEEEPGPEAPRRSKGRPRRGS